MPLHIEYKKYRDRRIGCVRLCGVMLSSHIYRPTVLKWLLLLVYILCCQADQMSSLSLRKERS